MEDDGYDSSEGADLRRAGRKLAKEIEMANGACAAACFCLRPCAASRATRVHVIKFRYVLQRCCLSQL